MPRPSLSFPCRFKDRFDIESIFRGQTSRHAMAGLVSLLLAAAVVCSAQQPVTLYNGIRLPAIWPPRSTPNLPAPAKISGSDGTLRLAEAPNDEPLETPPYLLSPPDVIPIDVGRQLFVDDFLIDETTLRRTFHTAEYYSGNPILKPDKPWERAGAEPRAMVFSDGVWFDPQDRLYKMWYFAARQAVGYAISKDGVHWEKPALDVQPGTNLVNIAPRDSSIVWLDLEDKDPQRRYKLAYTGGNMKPFYLHFSADGIHWGAPVTQSIPVGDRTTLFWNPFRKVWVFSIRNSTPEHNRYRSYWEHPDIMAGIHWKPEDPAPWVGADRLDARRLDLNVKPELYNLDAVAYESVLLGLFSIWRGQPPDRPKPNEIVLGYSRDGFHWARPSRRPFIPVSERHGDWNWGNVQSAGGGCLVVGDRLFFYVSGRAGVPGTRSSGVCTTGLATLRRDGFASMDAGPEEGHLTTRSVSFRGRHLFVNADAEPGELRVEVLDAAGRPIPAFSKANCRPVRSNNTLQLVQWRAEPDLGSLAGKPVRFRFHLRHARLYAFWVSPDSSGASHGYVAAGGPGFTGPVDTVGSAIYRNCCASDFLH